MHLTIVMIRVSGYQLIVISFFNSCLLGFENGDDFGSGDFDGGF